MASPRPRRGAKFEDCALAQRSEALKAWFESRSGLKITKFMIFMILAPYGCHINLVSQRKSVSIMLQSSWAFACTSLECVSRWAFNITENLFTDSEIIWKNHPKILLKSAGCRGAVCPGGVLLTEVEASPLQVIWRLRVGAAPWGFWRVVWEPELPKNHNFHDFHNFVTLGRLRIISSPQEKWYPEWWYGAELLHVTRLKVCRGAPWSSSKIFLRILRYPWKTTVKFF